MKTIEKSHYFDPRLEEEIKQELQQFHHEVALDGENHGRRGLPTVSEPDVKSYYHGHHISTQKMINTVGMATPKAALIAEVQEDEKQRDSKIQAIENKLHKVKQQLHDAGKKLANLKPAFSKTRLWLSWLAMCLPMLADAIISIPVWETWGFNFIEAAVISLIFAGALVTLAHYFERIVCFLGKTLWQRRIITILLLLLVVSAFYYMADARAEYRTSQLAAQGILVHFKPIPFALVTTIIFIIALTISKFAFPSRVQREQMEEYTRMKAEHQVLLDDEQKLEHEKADIIQKHEQLKQTNLSILLRAAALEEMIITHAHHGFTEWKRANTMHRPDRLRPNAFNDDQYPFAFNTNFSDIKRLFI